MKKKKYSIPKYIAIIAIILLLIISYYLYNKSTENYNYIKLDKSKYLVYTESEKQFANYNQYKPYVNIKGDLGTTINNNITDFMNSFSKNNICITYEYDLNGKILSLVIKVEDYSLVESAAILYFRSYNINLDTQSLLSKDELLNLFDLTNNEVEPLLNQEIEKYYNELVKNNNIENCNYDCFIKSRDFQTGLDDAEYFVRDGKLIVFKPYIYMSQNNSEIKYDFEINH